MTRFAFFALFLCSIGCASTDGHHHDHPIDVGLVKAEINLMMEQAAEDWTANDLDGFMQSFHNSPDLTFAIPTGITKGWAPLKARYAKSIAKSDLWFTDIQTTVITPDTALVFARFNNQVGDDKSTYSTGLTTLLVREIDERWVIVHDHSSGLPADYPK